MSPTAPIAETPAAAAATKGAEVPTGAADVLGPTAAEPIPTAAAADGAASTRPPAGVVPEPAAASTGSPDPAPTAAIPELDSESALPSAASESPLESGTVALTDGGGVPAADAFGETIGQGGPVLLVLALLSVAALSILLVKLWQFSRLRLNAAEPAEEALRHWYRREPERALAAVDGSPQPTARLLAHAFRGLAVPGADLGLLREELSRFAVAQLEQLRAWLRALEVIAALSPLLGLLGTVLGMIEAFRQLELAGAQVNPALLSGGIWQALLTTAAGLGVAIPVVLLHSWLERRVERCGHRMEDALTRVFTRDVAAPHHRAPLERPRAVASPATAAVTEGSMTARVGRAP